MRRSTLFWWLEGLSPSLPSLHSDEEDEEARPLTREELKSKTLNRLSRRAGKEALKAKAKRGGGGGGR